LTTFVGPDLAALRKSVLLLVADSATSLELWRHGIGIPNDQCGGLRLIFIAAQVDRAGGNG
jgi:hypothetical protein